MRSGVDVEQLDAVADAALLGRLTAAMEAGAARPAAVVRDGELLVAERIRRTRQVTVGAALAAELHARLDALRPRLERRFAVALGRCEPPQFLRYERGDRFKAHADGDVARRVSLVLFVTGRGPAGEREPHGGGLLTFFDTAAAAAGCRVAMRPPAGAAIAFPSELVHTVTPLRHGTRLSVVTWFPPAG